MAAAATVRDSGGDVTFDLVTYTWAYCMGPGTYIYTIGRAEKHSRHCTDRGLFVSFLYREVFDSTESTVGPIVHAKSWSDIHGDIVPEDPDTMCTKRTDVRTRLTRDRQTVLSRRSSVNRDYRLEWQLLINVTFDPKGYRGEHLFRIHSLTIPTT